MPKKYFCWSFDDGLEQDKKIIRILKTYEMGATFHLNSGLFGDKTYEGRIGNLGFIETPAAKYDPARFHLLPAVPHFRIPEDELKDVYEGFEIASHTRTHVNLAKCDEATRRREIQEDLAALSSIFGQKVTGFAYPYGTGAGQCHNVLKQAGVLYARTVGSDQSYHFPKDPLAMPMTSWHISSKAFDRIDQFLQMKPEEDDLFFLMFAHGYEFDFGTKESNWEKFERICERVSGKEDVVCCSIGEAFRQHQGR